MKTSFVTNSMNISGNDKFRCVILSLMLRLPIVYILKLVLSLMKTSFVK
jgi:hypothetical protein